MPRDASNTTAPSARPGNWARRSRSRGASRPPLVRKSTGKSQSFIGIQQLRNFGLQHLHACVSKSGSATPYSGLDLITHNPFIERLRSASILWRNRLDDCPKRSILASALLLPNRFDLFIAQSPWRFKSPQNTGRFTTAHKRRATYSANHNCLPSKYRADASAASAPSRAGWRTWKVGASAPLIFLP